ncbi:hypothetical protein ACFLZH_01870, partial [Patescibacteria group bacterium]
MNPDVLKIADQQVLDITNPEHLELAGITDATAETIIQIKQLLDADDPEGYQEALDLSFALAENEENVESEELTYADTVLQNVMDGII